jgi:hypothetical protein
MKHYLLIVVAAILLTATSCKSFVVSMAGLRLPKIEDKTSILKMLVRFHQDTSDVYTIDSMLFGKFRKEKFKPNWANGFRPVQIRVYDHRGVPVMQWALCEGFLKDLKTFDTVPPRNINGLNSSLTLQEDLSQYFGLSGKPANIIAPKGFDYYILVYFAGYFPKWSRESFRQVDKYIRKHPELKMKVYKINVDVQKFWNVEVNADNKVSIGGH